MFIWFKRKDQRCDPLRNDNRTWSCCLQWYTEPLKAFFSVCSGTVLFFLFGRESQSSGNWNLEGGGGGGGGGRFFCSVEADEDNVILRSVRIAFFEDCCWERTVAKVNTAVIFSLGCGIPSCWQWKLGLAFYALLHSPSRSLLLSSCKKQTTTKSLLLSWLHAMLRLQTSFVMCGLFFPLARPFASLISALQRSEWGPNVPGNKYGKFYGGGFVSSLCANIWGSWRKKHLSPSFCYTAEMLMMMKPAIHLFRQRRSLGS